MLNQMTHTIYRSVQSSQVCSLSACSCTEPDSCPLLPAMGSNMQHAEFVDQSLPDF